MASVTFHNVVKKFDGQIALDDLSIEVADREFLLLVGPSGCGKTTALRILAGLETVTSGRIMIGDRVVNDVAPKDRDIAMVFQSYALYPHLSVFENMAFGLRLRNAPATEISRRVRKAAEALGLEHLLHRKPHQLSGGQRQRVALGRAIVREPKVFLFDEPLSSLDAALRVQMRAEIQKLHRRLQATFIYVTHDQTEAMTLATRIAVINGGRLQQLDTPHNLYGHPANLFVAGFIGSPAMNFFPARLVKEDGRLMVEAADFRLRIPPERIPRYEAHNGRPVIFGIRPENIHDAGFSPADIRGERVVAQVDVGELLGSESILYLVAGDRPFIARVDPRTRLQVGDSAQLVFDMERIHLFDSATGDAF